MFNAESESQVARMLFNFFRENGSQPAAVIYDRAYVY